jgi:hypothetical protein
MEGYLGGWEGQRLGIVYIKFWTSGFLFWNGGVSVLFRILLVYRRLAGCGFDLESTLYLLLRVLELDHHLGLSEQT